jgi:hypothetical protein
MTRSLLEPLLADHLRVDYAHVDPLLFGPLLYKPLPRPATEPMPEWVNLGFAVLSLAALVLGVVWLIRRGGLGGGPPWRR